MSEDKATKKAPTLPSWAEWKKGQAFVNIDEVYPRYLKMLGLEPTQFSTGVARLCITRDLANLTGMEGLTVRFQCLDKEAKKAWLLENLPVGEASHDQGMKQGGKLRQRIIEYRNLVALAHE